MGLTLLFSLHVKKRITQQQFPWMACLYCLDRGLNDWSAIWLLNVCYFSEHYKHFIPASHAHESSVWGKSGLNHGLIKPRHCWRSQGSRLGGTTVPRDRHIQLRPEVGDFELASWAPPKGSGTRSKNKAILDSNLEIWRIFSDYMTAHH